MKRSKKYGKTNRQYKDTIFADLFSNDIDAEDNVLSLVNALYDMNLEKGHVKYKKEKLESTFRVTDLKNDVSFMLDGRLLVLFEHQSTINENMPLRCFLYCAEYFKRHIISGNYFKEIRTKIPCPQFFVFYNGKRNYEKDLILKLSDSFMSYKNNTPDKMSKKSGSYMEITIRMININHSKNHEILAKCNIIRQYSIFSELIQKAGLKFERKNETEKESEQREKENLYKIKQVVDYCKANDILADYFERKGGEVYAMLLEQYSEEYKLECEKKLHEDYEKKIAAQQLHIQKVEKEKELANKRANKEKKARQEAQRKAEQEKKEKEELQKQLFLKDIKVIIQFLDLGVDKDTIYNCIDKAKDNLDDIVAIINDNKSTTDEEIYNILFVKDNTKDSVKHNDKAIDDNNNNEQKEDNND